jgi:hypothetical protein
MEVNCQQKTKGGENAGNRRTRTSMFKEAPHSTTVTTSLLKHPTKNAFAP